MTNDRNRLEVVADRIRFTVQPQDGVINTNLDPFAVSALDANGNKDLDATNDVTLSTSGTGMTDSSPYTMSNGDAVISDVQFDTAQSDITITATTTDLDADNDDESEPFDILDVPDGSYRTTSDGTWHKHDGTGTADWASNLPVAVGKPWTINLPEIRIIRYIFAILSNSKETIRPVI